VDTERDTGRPEAEPGAAGPPTEGDRQPIAKRYPPMLWERAIDRAIRESQARGDFDDLPGKGKPIDLGEEAGDGWLAAHLLRSQGFAPAWIEDDRAIAAERAALEALLDRHAAWAREHGIRDPAGAERIAAEFRRRAEALNGRIARHNLSVPSASLQRRSIAVEAALAAFRDRLPA